MDYQERTLELRRVLTKSSKAIVVSKKIVKTTKVRGPDSQLYTAMCPIVYAIRVFGLAPYEFHNENLVSSSVNSIYSYICASLYTYIMYTIVTRFTNIERDHIVLSHTERVKAIFNYSVSMIDIIVTISTRTKFVRIWNTLQDFDEIVKNLGYPRTEMKVRVWSWIILSFNFIVWFGINRTGMLAFGEAWLNNVAYMLIYVGTSISVIKFSCIVIVFGQRFDHLNSIAKKSGPTSSRWLLASPVVDSKDVEHLHNILMNACESLNSVYSWCILLWLANLSVHTVSDFYFVIEWMILGSWSMSYWKLVLCLSTWIVMFLGQLIFLHYACHFASDEANSMGYILFNWRRWIFGRGRYEEVETSLHLINRRLNFSAAGCFNVNLPLLRSIAGLLSTYLVILLQLPN